MKNSHKDEGTLSRMCSWILDFLGWDSDIKFPEFTDREIWIFPHESCWDFVLFGLYKLCYPTQLSVYTVVKPQLFETPLKSIVIALDCIPATRLEENGKGFVQNTAEMFKDRDRFRILISPKGTINDSPWRSGYYYLARELNAKIRVVGLDYRRHKVTFRNPYNLSSRDELERNLKFDVASIPQLNPPSVMTSAIDPPLWAKFLIVVIGLMIVYILLYAITNGINYFNRK